RVRIELFTAEEANKLAVDIRPRLERLVEKKREFDGLEKRMSILLVATSGAAPENPDARELRSLEEKRRRLGGSIGKAGHELHESISEFADFAGDSFKLSQLAAAEDQAQYIVFCGVHFMAESADVLAQPQQTVILPDLKAGCSMADMASLDDVEDAWDLLLAEHGDTFTPITYMNSSAALKAFCGARGGIVCTSSNAHAALEWAWARKPRVLFFPDQHL